MRTRGFWDGWFGGFVTGSLMMFGVGTLMIVYAQNGGYQRGFKAGVAEQRQAFATLVCQLPGRVDESCAGLALPLCEFEDGTPEGCLRRDSDGTWYWEINQNGDQ